MTKKINELKGKVKEVSVEAKEWFSDHKVDIAVYGTMTGIIVGGIVGGIVLGRLHDKKYENAWHAAKTAYENGQLDADFGPYKLMRFLEPTTGEFIGETMCHKDTVEAFLKLK